MFPDYHRSRRIKNPQILVIEDNKDHQALIAYCLRNESPPVQPVFATTPAEGLAHLLATSNGSGALPHLVLLDLYLPDIQQGWDTLTEIRTRYPRLPVIVLSSNQEAAIIVKAYELGARSFMQKPVGFKNWESQFRVFFDFWFGTSTLPPNH